MIRRLKREEGVSLVELLVGLAATSIIALIAFTALNTTSSTELVSSNDSQALATLRLGFQRLVKELRQAGKIYPEQWVGSDLRGSTVCDGDPDDPPDCKQTKIEFWVDGSDDCAGNYRDPDGYQQEQDRIIWEVTTVNGKGALTRRTRCPGSGTLTWVEDIVVQDVFIYNQAPPTTTLVTVTLAADVNPDLRSPPRSITTEVRLRNAPG